MAEEQPFDPDMYTKALSLTATYHRDVYPAVSPTNPANSASGKYILVTGASAGIGRSIAIAFAQAGAAGVAIVGRNEQRLEAVAKQLEQAGNGKTEVMSVVCRVEDEEGIKKLFEDIKERFGKLDAVIANAGIIGQEKEFLKVGEISTVMWWGDLDVNLKGTYLTAHYYVTTFGTTGTFIGLTSGHAALTMPGVSSYAISKIGIQRLIEFMAVEYPELRTFTLNPGIVDTGHMAPELLPFTRDTPELNGGVCCWLVSGQADWLTGCCVSVNWDVETMVKHKDEIVEKNLLKTRFLHADLGPAGQPWEDGKEA